MKNILLFRSLIVFEKKEKSFVCLYVIFPMLSDMPLKILCRWQYPCKIHWYWNKSWQSLWKFTAWHLLWLKAWKNIKPALIIKIYRNNFDLQGNLFPTENLRQLLKLNLSSNFRALTEEKHGVPIPISTSEYVYNFFTISKTLNIAEAGRYILKSLMFGVQAVFIAPYIFKN